jgi:hypothetical protein
LLISDVDLLHLSFFQRLNEPCIFLVRSFKNKIKFIIRIIIIMILANNKLTQKIKYSYTFYWHNSG